MDDWKECSDFSWRILWDKKCKMQKHLFRSSLRPGLADASEIVPSAHGGWALLAQGRSILRGDTTPLGQLSSLKGSFLCLLRWLLKSWKFRQSHALEVHLSPPPPQRAEIIFYNPASWAVGSLALTSISSLMSFSVLQDKAMPLWSLA